MPTCPPDSTGINLGFGMAEIRPFRGLRYGPRFVGRLASLLCPPYDVISPTQEQALRRGRYNMVHLELPGGDYSGAAARLAQWRGEGVLFQDEEPAFYLHHHRFHHEGRDWLRRGLVAAVRLEAGAVKPHEGTLPRPKQDRLNLLRATGTQISPIFSLYQDPGGEVAKALALVEASPPLMEASVNGEGHRVWAIGNQDAKDRLPRLFHPLTLFIADGHHRFETALTYRGERGGGTGKEAHHFTMMTLVATTDPGLLVLPVHRLVRGIAPQKLRALEERLRASFEIRDYPLDRVSPEEVLTPHPSETVIGVVGLRPGRLGRLSLRAGSAPAQEAQVLHQRVLGDLGREAEIVYTPYSSEVLQRLGEYQLGFLLHPMPVEEITRAALAGERLPGKSTYFYPKLPAGLALFPVEGEL